MAGNKQTNAFLTVLLEMPQTLAEIARDVGGWVARVWKDRLSRHWFFIALLGYLFLSYFIHGHVQPVNPKIFKLSYWLAEPSDKLLLSETIRNLVLAIGGWLGLFAAFTGLILAYQRTKAANQQAEAALKQSVTAFESLVTERFTRAVEQLGHEKSAVRLGAIYALERIAKDSARDRDTILETLTAYIREHARADQGEAIEGQQPPIDMDAAIKVFARLR